MRHLRPGLSITRATVFVILACAARVAMDQGEGETFTIILPGDVPPDGSAAESPTGTHRVIRGGGGEAQFYRAAGRIVEL